MENQRKPPPSILHRSKKGLTIVSPFRLSRNYSFADKQERTAGRSKVVQKFPYGNFFPLKV